MNTNKLQAAAKIIMEGALETLASVHGCTIQQVRDEIAAGHVKLNNQFKELADRGIEEAMKLHQQNKISLA